MPSVLSFPASAVSWQTLPPAPSDATQLDSMKAHLDLLLLALEALTDIGSEAMLQAAAELHLSGMNDRVGLWRLRQSNPLRKGQGGRKKLDVEEARALVLMICHLAQQHQRRIRSGVGLLEQVTEQGRHPHTVALLGDYLDAFCNCYQERMTEEGQPEMEDLTALALKLLIDLLFYTGSGGPRRLWLALLDRSESTLNQS